MGLILLAGLGAVLVYFLFVSNITSLPDEPPVSLKDDLYDEIIRQLENRGQNIKEGMKRNYPDIFR